MTGGPPARPGPPAHPAPFAGEPAPLVPSLPNLRDVGGHPTADGGRVRTGLSFHLSP